MTWEPEDFDDLGSELRRRMGAEIREEAEEIERLSELQRRRRGSLPEVARAAMHRGDSVTMALGARSWTGTLSAVGDDYAVLSTGQEAVEFPLAAAVITTKRSRSGGQSGRPASITWRARLAELAAEEVPVRILVRGSEDVVGRIDVVAIDHVEVSAEVPAYVPLGLIEAITSVP